MNRSAPKKAAILFCLFALCLLSGCAGRTLSGAPARLNEVDAASRYYYLQLDQTEQAAYAAVLDQIGEHPDRIPVPPLNDEQLHRVFCALSYDNPELICLGNSCRLLTQGSRYYLNLDYAFEPNTCAEMTNRLMEAVSQVLGTVPPGSDTYTIELAFHDWLVLHCTYESTEDSWVPYTAYGALVEGRAACEGYSRAMQLLLNRCGIPNYLITGDATDTNGLTQGHMWNIVTVDGADYHVDVTWDDPVATDMEQFSHIYFNVMDAQIAADHTKWEPAAPNCTATAANYFVRSGLLLSDYNENARNTIVEAIASAAHARRPQVEFQFAEEQAYRAARDDLLGEGSSRMYRLLARANLSTDIRLNTQAFTYICDDTSRVLRFDIPYMDG